MTAYETPLIYAYFSIVSPSTAGQFWFVYPFESAGEKLEVIPDQQTQQKLTAEEQMEKIRYQVDEEEMPGLSASHRIYWDDWESDGAQIWNENYQNRMARAVDLGDEIRCHKQEMLLSFWYMIIDTLELDAVKNKIVMALICRYHEMFVQAATENHELFVRGGGQPTELANCVKVSPRPRLGGRIDASHLAA